MMERNLEIWQGNSKTAPYRWLVRDAEPPRSWYGAVDDGRGGWRFEELPDDTLVAEGGRFDEPANDSQCSAVLQAFRQQVLGESA